MIQRKSTITHKNFMFATLYQGLLEAVESEYNQGARLKDLR